MSTIPQLADLKRRLGDLNLKKARGGYSTAPEVSMEADDLQTVISLMERIDIHRRNLDHMLRQRDHFGPNVPNHIASQIDNERAQVVQLRRSCARLGQIVPEHTVDDDAEPELPPIVTRPATPPPSDIRSKLDQIERLLNEIRAQLK